MSHTKQLAGAAAGMISCLSLVAFAPPASSAEGADLGRARNDIGNFSPGSPDPADLANTGWETSDVVIASVAGVLIAGGGIGTAIALRRRHPAAHAST